MSRKDRIDPRPQMGVEKGAKIIHTYHTVSEMPPGYYDIHQWEVTESG